jgi:hypothetical protein
MADPPNRAYKALNDYFTQHEDDIVEIEMLPPAFPPPDGILMHEDLSLGVPKKTLVLAFNEARQLFFASKKVDGISSQVAFEATRIILLFDPEHITAANFRKRRLVELQRNLEDGDFPRAVQQELFYLNSILTSPLHRQSKSPTLWHHRAWLLNLSLPTKLGDSTGEQFLTSVRAEFDAVFKAGEKHPKNYYAWQYARRLLLKIERLYEDETIHGWKTSYHSFLCTCALLVKSWCCKHPSDISGWTLLFFLLPKINSISSRRSIVAQVLELTTKLHFEQESLWVFIRLVLADTLLGYERTPMIQQLQAYYKELNGNKRGRDEDDLFTGRVARAITWIEQHNTLLSDKETDLKANVS